MEPDKLIELSRYDALAESQLLQSAPVTEIPLGSQMMVPYLRTPYLYYELKLGEILSPGRRVLELGAGGGMHTKVLLETGADVVASDISPNSLKLLRSRFINAYGNLETTVADMEYLPFESQSFDVVACAGSLSYGDNLKVINEISRVLKKDGVFVCVDSLHHNPIYKLNRLMNYLANNRTRSTLLRMPTVEVIDSYAASFQTCEVKFFGAFSWLMHLINRLIGGERSEKLSEWLDRLVNVRKSAFKFVIIARAPISYAKFDSSLEKSIQDYPKKNFDECRLRYVRFAKSEIRSAQWQNTEKLLKLLTTRVPTGWVITLERPWPLAIDFCISLRGNMLLNWLVLNNVFQFSFFRIILRAPGGELIHRMTVIGRDIRKSYLNDAIEISQVWTNPAYRGRHIARSVLASVLEAEPAVQVHWVVRKENVASVALAESCGLKFHDMVKVKSVFGINYFYNS